MINLPSNKWAVVCGKCWGQNRELCENETAAAKSAGSASGAGETPPDIAIRKNNLALGLWLRVSTPGNLNAEIKCGDKKLLPGVKM